MVSGFELFFSLFNNLAIFIALVAIYGYLIEKFTKSDWYIFQTILGLAFGVFSIICMHAKIPVFEGVIVDQRNAIIALSGAFGGPWAAILSAALAGAYRVYLGGGGAFAGFVGVTLAAIAGIILNRFPGPFASTQKSAVSSLFATIIILPGFLFVGDIQTGWQLMKAMTVPYGSAILFGIFLVGLLLHREEQRYLAEQSSRKSEAKYRLLVEGTNDLITNVDIQGNFTFVNKMAEKYFGLTPNECIGVSAFKFIHPDDQDMTEKWFRASIAKKLPQDTIENRQVNIKTNEIFNMLWTISFQYNKQGKMAKLSGIARDITERKKAEEAQRKSDTRYHTLFKYAPYGILIADQESYYTDANPALCRMLGYTRDEFIGLHASDIVAPTEIQHIATALQEVKIKTDYFRVWKLRKKDGSVFDAEISVNTLPDGHLLGIIRDITDRIKLQMQLDQAQKMESVGRLAGGVAHDYNNMLSVIMGYSELSLDRLDPTDPLHGNITEIFKAAERSMNITRQLLAFARQQTIAPKVLDLNETVEQMLKMLRRLIGEDIDLAWHPRANIGLVNIDPGQIDQLLANLCVNARDAIADIGKITIETDQVYFDEAYCEENVGFAPGEYVMLGVSDNGCGMDAETMAKIFEPFFTTKDLGIGTGLGLATVYGIVKQNKGFINVYSEPGKGTTFKVYLARHEKNLIEDKNVTIVEIPRGLGEVLLVVEDEVSILKLAERLLVDLDYRVMTASTPDEALQIAGSFSGNISLLITDVIMPGMNGRELAERIQPLHPKIKCLFMSGYTSNVIAHHGVLKDGVNYIQKPFAKNEFAIKVRNALDNK